MCKAADVRISRDKLNIIFGDKEMGKSANENIISLCVVDSDCYEVNPILDKKEIK